MKRNLILLASVALVVLMTMSVIAFSWPWQTTGNAVDTRTAKVLKISEGQPKTFILGGVNYTVSIEYMTKETVRLKVNDEISPTMAKGYVLDVGGLEVKINNIKYSSKTGVISYATIQFKTAQIVSGCKGTKCTIFEGDSITTSVNDKNYEVIIDFVGSESVSLDINGERTSSLAEGQTYRLSDGNTIVIKDILYTSKIGALSGVVFSFSNTINQSSKVTYAGVLNMLGSCKGIKRTGDVNITKENSCDSICTENHLICTFGIYGYKSSVDTSSTLINFISCNSQTSPVNADLTCLCCSAP